MSCRRSTSIHFSVWIFGSFFTSTCRASQQPLTPITSTPGRDRRRLSPSPARTLGAHATRRRRTPAKAMGGAGRRSIRARALGGVEASNWWVLRSWCPDSFPSGWIFPGNHVCVCVIYAAWTVECRSGKTRFCGEYRVFLFAEVLRPCCHATIYVNVVVMHPN